MALISSAWGRKRLDALVRVGIYFPRRYEFTAHDSDEESQFHVYIFISYDSEGFREVRLGLVVFPYGPELEGRTILEPLW